jgi:hypothetical protein
MRDRRLRTTASSDPILSNSIKNSDATGRRRTVRDEYGHHGSDNDAGAAPDLRRGSRLGLWPPGCVARRVEFTGSRLNSLVRQDLAERVEHASSPHPPRVLLFNLNKALLDIKPLQKAVSDVLLDDDAAKLWFTRITSGLNSRERRGRSDRLRHSYSPLRRTRLQHPSL